MENTNENNLEISRTPTRILHPPDTQRSQVPICPEIRFTVETTQEMEERKFFMALTGQEIPQDLFNVADYLGTFQLSGGSIVCHLFEIQDPISALVRTTLTGQ